MKETYSDGYKEQVLVKVYNRRINPDISSKKSRHCLETRIKSTCELNFVKGLCRWQIVPQTQ